MKTIKYVDYKKLPKYPHLMPEDVAVWEKFISRYPDYFDKVAYDVAIGKGRDYSMLPKDKYRDDLELLTKKRIDVIGIRGDETSIIEIKPVGNPQAIGQLLVYWNLFREQYPGSVFPFPTLICNYIDPDTRIVAESEGVRIVALEEV